jgi:hypothetical protein
MAADRELAEFVTRFRLLSVLRSSSRWYKLGQLITQNT